MRISDLSSDVCASDLAVDGGRSCSAMADAPAESGNRPRKRAHHRYRPAERQGAAGQPKICESLASARSSRTEERLSGKSVSVSVDLGGRRIIKNRNTTKRMHISNIKTKQKIN